MTPKSAPKVNLRVGTNRLGRQKRTGGPKMTPKSAPKAREGPLGAGERVEY
jgi:hypothetical protein